MINRTNQSLGRKRQAKTEAAIRASLFLGALALPLFTPPRASAQTPPGLDLQLYAGLSITGAVGTVYSVEYVTDLAQTQLLALSGVPATARQPVSVGRQVRTGDGPAVLPGGGVCSPDEPGVHPAGHVPDGQPDERSGPQSETQRRVRRRR